MVVVDDGASLVLAMIEGAKLNADGIVMATMAEANANTDFMIGCLFLFSNKLDLDLLCNGSQLCACFVDCRKCAMI